MGKIGEGAIENRALAFFSVVAINSNLSTTGAKVITLSETKKWLAILFGSAPNLMQA
jgi:hypothetical protein